MSATILIVDDNAIVLKLVCAYVERAGYDVVAATSLAGAIEKACARRSIDVVVVDVVMPGGGGFELVRSLKRSHPAVRTLYMSAYPDASLTGDFIAKPFSSEALLEALQGLVDRQPEIEPNRG